MFFTLALGASRLPYLHFNFLVLHSLLQISEPRDVSVLLLPQLRELVIVLLFEVVVLDGELHELLIQASVYLLHLAVCCSQFGILSQQLLLQLQELVVVGLVSGLLVILVA